ncbi:hypothetical protein MPTK1_1g05870 [Marchantia polymorpha subsp. ruderalis]|uniref:DUF4057 domain-containing protein n=2 Tax=Marchantia polymorpha TaxID=3197 RepID=A0AAF6ALY5_MARPO|nr:hypothetical protein MARPO_0005s0021 [Marchantia polymorpha]BBM97455.1 hypothetical protein Mp_1g05870 [Marchantia polymorpha subsp. ruderalis]|eukprot:PTQ48348.1 hypothetical protein MARPO_0005s0021 [Marchantia polymorpha]
MPVENSPASTLKRGTTPPGGPSTFDLFSWSEGPDTTQRTAVRHSATNDSAAFAAASDQSCTSPPSRPTIRMHQPAGGASTFAFGEQMTPEEAEALVKRRPNSECKKKEMYGNAIFGEAALVNRDQESARPGSEVKRKEMFGSGIFVEGAEGGEHAGITSQDRTCVRLHQPAGGVSQIQFGGEELTSPKKPTSIPEVAKQRELSGSTETTLDLKHRSFSNAKAKELVGSNIFGPAPPDAPPRRVAMEPAGGRSQIAFGHDDTPNSARKVDPHKIAELSGNNIFADDPQTPVADPHHHLSHAKLREMSGSDIFKDDKPVNRDSIGGIRKPPGGGSTIALV